MVEFYFKYFKKNYSSKIKQLILDLDRLMHIENISLLVCSEDFLDEKYLQNLNKEQRSKINNIYFTLYQKNLSL